MKFLPSLKTLKQRIGEAVYYGAVPIMIFVGIKCALNSTQEMEEMASYMSGAAPN